MKFESQTLVGAARPSIRQFSAREKCGNFSREKNARRSNEALTRCHLHLFPRKLAFPPRCRSGGEPELARFSVEGAPAVSSRDAEVLLVHDVVFTLEGEDRWSARLPPSGDRAEEAGEGREERDVKVAVLISEMPVEDESRRGGALPVSLSMEPLVWCISDPGVILNVIYCGLRAQREAWIAIH